MPKSKAKAGDQIPSVDDIFQQIADAVERTLAVMPPKEAEALGFAALKSGMAQIDAHLKEHPRHVKFPGLNVAVYQQECTCGKCGGPTWFVAVEYNDVLMMRTTYFKREESAHEVSKMARERLATLLGGRIVAVPVDAPSSMVH